jgi:DNA-binding NtrC family response regulator
MTTNSPMHVLLVDDDPSILKLLESFLQADFREEVHIHAASEPTEARWRLESEVVDLLITDLEMPGVSGLELLRCAKRANVWTQVLLITGHSNVRALMDAMDLGASDYLLKPLDMREFEEAVKSILRRTSRWRQALVGTLSSR